MKKIFLIGAVFTNCSLLLAQDLATPESRKYSEKIALSQLDAYFLEKSSGSITPSMRRDSLKNLDLTDVYFARDLELKRYLPWSTSVETNQTLFDFDVKKFTSLENSSDFITAKREFYSRLSFDEKTQLHERPYYYLSDWNSQFHPPIQTLTESLDTYAKEFVPVDRASLESDYFDPKFHVRMDQLSKSELSIGNRIQPLMNGDSIHEKIRLAKESKKTFYAMVLAFMCDSTTEPLADAMIERAQAGVDVRLVVDAMIRDLLTKKCIRKMKRGGVKVVAVPLRHRPKKGFAVFHNKIWIRDMEEAIMGGQNILAAQNEADGFNNYNRDSDALFRTGSPMVTDMAREYVKIWNEFKKDKSASIFNYHRAVNAKLTLERAQGLRGKAHYEKWMSTPESRMNGVCRMIVQRPFLENGVSIAKVFAGYAAVARSQMLVTSPKIRFDPEYSPNDTKVRYPELENLYYTIFERARNTGLKVDFVSNGVDGGNGELSAFFREKVKKAIEAEKFGAAKRWSKFLTRDSRGIAVKNRAFLNELQTIPGIRAFTYMNYIHAKQVMFDRIAYSIGSTNWEMNSFETSHESTMICQDQEFSDAMDRQFVLDLVNSVPVTSSNE